jgi:hypothetical protein
MAEDGGGTPCTTAVLAEDDSDTPCTKAARAEDGSCTPCTTVARARMVTAMGLRTATGDMAVTPATRS